MSTKQEYYLPNEAATIKLAQQLANLMIFPLVMTLSGDLGAGKTSFIRALLNGLGVKGSIKSPTFSLVESYQVKQLAIHHFDLYRIQDEAELEYIGFKDFFTSDSFCCIEWPERAPHSLSHVDIQARLTYKGDGRLMHCIASTVTGETVLSYLAGQQ